MIRNYIRPVVFSVTYDQYSIQDYLEECEDTGETPKFVSIDYEYT